MECIFIIQKNGEIPCGISPLLEQHSCNDFIIPIVPFTGQIYNLLMQVGASCSFMGFPDKSGRTRREQRFSSRKNCVGYKYA